MLLALTSAIQALATVSQRSYPPSTNVVNLQGISVDSMFILSLGMSLDHASIWSFIEPKKSMRFFYKKKCNQP